MLELYLIRHGQSTSNRDGYIQGQSDVSLSETGIRQSELLQRRLKTLQFDHVYSSDLIRASHTAQIALPEKSASPDPRLREIHLGILEGRVFADLSAEEKNMLEAHHGEDWEFRVPEGESYVDLENRSREFLSGLPEEGKVLAFTHGGFIIASIYSIIGRPPKRDFESAKTWGMRLENTSITRIVRHKGFSSIVTVGDHAHLEDPL